MDQEDFNALIEQIINEEQPTDIMPLEAAAQAFVHVLLPYTEEILLLPGPTVAILYMPQAEQMADYFRARMGGYFGEYEFDAAVCRYIVNTIIEVRAEQEQQSQEYMKKSPYAGGMYLN